MAIQIGPSTFLCVVRGHPLRLHSGTRLRLANQRESQRRRHALCAKTLSPA